MDKPMELGRFKGLLAEGKLDRRAVNRVLASVGVATVALPLKAGLAQDAPSYPTDDELTVFTWAGYEVPDLFMPYVNKHGKVPSFTFFGEEEEALQKLRTGFPADLSAPCTYSTARWRDAGVIKPIDTSRLEHWADIFDSLKTLEGSLDAAGNNYFLPIDWGNSSVLYRTDLVDPAYLNDESWTILFDERYKGRLGIYDSVDGVMGVVGLVVGAANPFDMTEEELAKATELLKKQREVLRFYWTDITAVEQGLASGELVASYAWNSSVVALKKQGVPIKYAVPKEGIYTWVCGQVLVTAGEGSEAKAYDYLNAITAPESGAWEIQNYGYGSSNRKAFELVPKETLADLALPEDPVAFMAQSKYFREIKPDVRERYIQLFDEVKAGL
jgi:spermidine/putrescine-binding protein